MFGHVLLLLSLSACTDSGKPSDSDTVPAGNGAPVADAGTNTSGSTDAPVTLNGAGSSDPDGDALTWHWSFVTVPEGSQVATREAPFARNHDATAVTTTFNPDRTGTYVAQLIVNDGHQSSQPDQVVVTVEAPTTLPVANAGPDQAVAMGAGVNLDGSASYDPQGLTLTYAWTLVDKPSGSAAALSDAAVATPSFTADLKGVYVLSLVVANGVVSSAADSMTVTATGTDSAPVSNAGADQLAAEDCTTLHLDCSASSDPDGDKLTYQWEVQAKPSGSKVTNATFSDRTIATPTFYPDVAGDYTLSCAAYDGTTWATPDLMKISAAERATNTPPIVDAGAPKEKDGGTAECTESGYTYKCDECASLGVALGDDASVTDPDGDPLQIVWTVESGDATIAAPNTLSTQVTLENAEPTTPGACENTEYKFLLTVTDCTGAVSTDTVTYVLSCCGWEDTAK